MSGRGRQAPRRSQPPRSALPSGRLQQQQHQRPQAGPSATTGSFIKPVPAHEVFSASFPGETAKYGQVHLQKTPKRVYKAQKGGYILKEKEQYLLSNIWSLFYEAPRNEDGEIQFRNVLLAAEEYFHSTSKNYEFYVVYGEAPTPGIYKHWSSVLEQRNLAHSTPKPGTAPVRVHRMDFKGAMTLSEAYALAAKVIPSGQIFIDPECQKYIEMTPSYKEVLKTDVAAKNFAQRELIEQLNKMNLELSESKQEIAEIKQKNQLLEKENQQWKSMAGFHDVVTKKAPPPVNKSFLKQTYEVPSYLIKMKEAKEEQAPQELPLKEDPKNWADIVEAEEAEADAVKKLLKHNEELKQRLEKLEQKQTASPSISGHELARIKQANEDERVSRLIAEAMSKMKEDLQAQWLGQASYQTEGSDQGGDDARSDDINNPLAEQASQEKDRTSGSHM